MLAIQKKPTWHANVEVTFAGDKTIHRFVCEFTPIPQSELEAFSATQATDREISRRVVVGWEGVVGEAGEALEFNTENLEALLDMHPVAARIVRTYYDEIAGSKRKNL